MKKKSIAHIFAAIIAFTIYGTFFLFYAAAPREKINRYGEM